MIILNTWLISYILLVCNAVYPVKLDNIGVSVMFCFSSRFLSELLKTLGLM